MRRNYEDKLIRNYEDKAKKKPFFLIASGPSLTQSDVDAIRGKGTVIAINDNYLLAPWADYLYFCDPKWFQWHKDKPEFIHFKGQIYTQDKKTAEDNGYTYIESVSAQGLSESPERIHQGSNSGYQAINLAYHLGAEKVILLGYDMQTTDGKAHWFGHHPDKVVSNHKSFARHFDSLADHAKRLNLEIVNCSRQTALTCFERKPLETVL